MFVRQLRASSMFSIGTVATTFLRHGQFPIFPGTARVPAVATFSASSISRAEIHDKIEGANRAIDGNGGESYDVDKASMLTNDLRPSQPRKPTDREAWGTLVRNDVKEIIATFVVEGRSITFKRTMSRGMQPFTSRTAVLQYDDKSDLAGEHCVDGTIGSSGFKLKFDNGPTITGDINPSTMSLNKHVIDGSGAWKKL